MITRSAERRIDVYGNSGNFDSGGYYSGHFIFAQNIEPGTGKGTGRAWAAICAFGEIAVGHCSLYLMAGGGCSIYTTLEK